MVEKFNFYDIYGYLLPGIAFCGLVWAPFGLLFRVWPTQEFTSAILALVLSYFVGHLVQSFAMMLFPSTTEDKYGNFRQPSELLLDDESKKFTPVTKTKIADLAYKYFGLELKPEEKLGPRIKGLPGKRAGVQADKEKLEKLKKELAEHEKLSRDDQAAKAREEISETEGTIAKAQGEIDTLNEITQRRTDAFFQARSALLHDKKASYWEQFEGLYAMMRGLSAALAAAAAYFLGWASGLWHKLGGVASFVPNDVWASWAAVAVLILLIALMPSAAWDQAIKNAGKKNGKETGKKTNDKNNKDTPAIVSPALALQSALVAVAFLGGFLLSLGIKYPPSEKTPCVSGLISIVTCSDPKKTSEDGAVLSGIAAPSSVMILLAVGSIVASTRCLGAYKAFAGLFAEHVWRDFANLEAKWSSGKPEDDAEPEKPWGNDIVTF